MKAWLAIGDVVSPICSEKKRYTVGMSDFWHASQSCGTEC
ncbi:hypothetical protein SX4_0215 [Vibrio mimicus SX-4]|nr:hypothetical protein SX4_0215 [Vibrio mimicus SX-4]